MGIVRASIGVADAVRELVRGEQGVGFEDASLTVDPGRLDGVEPGALARQIAGDEADALPVLLDLAVVVADPGAHLLADVPGGVVPDHEQGLLAGGLELAAAPV